MLKWESLSEHQKRMLPWYESYLKDVRNGIETNSIFYLNLLEQSVEMWGLNTDPRSWPIPSAVDMSKTVSILNQIAREWSSICAEERDKFLPLVREFLEESFPSGRDTVKILIPGAGLCRLAVDMVQLGFNTEANEVSYHMLMVGQFILNSDLQEEGIALHPFVHSFSHHINRAQQLRQIHIPDLNISERVVGENLLSMVSGSFPDIYGPNINIKQSESYSNSAAIREIRAENRNSKDVVVTNFFMDTSSNILDYLETISHVLKDGGYWINFGPFMYHFEQDHQTELTADFDPCTGEVSNELNTPLKGIELSHEDVIQTATTYFPFKPIKQKAGIPSTYGTDVNDISMLGYQCSFWILQKVSIK